MDNDQLTKIKITLLPKYGILKLSDIEVLVNQEIELLSLGNLTFEAEGW